MRWLPTALLLLAVPLPAGAQAAEVRDRVTLSEILPALEGTELGALDLGPAPPPGAARTIRRDEVLAALRRAGRSTQGLAIPARVRVERAARLLDPVELRALAQDPLSRRVAPCVVGEVVVAAPLRVGEGALDIAVDGEVPPRSGTTAATLVVRQGERELRVPVRAEVRCPPPVVQPGDRLRVLARIGGVTASTEAIARQPGRVGDVIQVTRTPHAVLRARVLDARTAEVIP